MKKKFLKLLTDYWKGFDKSRIFVEFDNGEQAEMVVTLRARPALEEFCGVMEKTASGHAEFAVNCRYVATQPRLIVALLEYHGKKLQKRLPVFLCLESGSILDANWGVDYWHE